MSAHQESFDPPALPAPVRVPLTTFPDHECAYLPDRIATTRGVFAADFDGDVYTKFLDANFRRSGRLLYQPVCRGCRECVSIRVPVDRFHPSKSQRRVARRNRDLHLYVSSAVADHERFDLYRRYCLKWHKHEVGPTYPEFERFLYDSPVESIDFSYRDSMGKLLAVGICDVSKDALSSVYFYFDPEESHRSLGTFGALCEIDYARKTKIPFYYLGYLVRECKSMRYKADFKPYQLLDPSGVWRDA